MVTYEEFKALIREKGEEVTGNRVVINKINKNNGVVLDGLQIISMDRNVAPTIYLNSFYEQYKDCMDIEEDPIQVIWESIYRLYKQNLPDKDFDLNKFIDFEYVKDKLKIKLVNYKENEEWLKDLAYVPFLDLAMVFYVWIDNDFIKYGSITVKKEHMEMWGKTETELLDIAMENMKEDYELAPLEKILTGGICGVGWDDVEFNIPLFFLSNRARTNGAAAILCEGVLKRFAIKHSCDKVIILPCSVHEVLLVPLEEGKDYGYFNRVVREANRTAVERESVLSNHVYVYDSNLNRIS